MKNALYKNIPIFMGLGGLLVSSIVCFTYYSIQVTFYNYFWICVIAFSTVISIFCGLWMKNIIYYAYKDPLTDLYNRRYLYEKLESELKRLNRSKTALSLVIIDIDHFKKVNDRYGHLAGDKLLTRISKIFTENSREIDTIARWGGEEFAIILPDTDNQGALKYAEKIRKAIEKSQKCFGVTVCIGLATIDKPIDMDILFAEADKALFQAKSVRNKVVGVTLLLGEIPKN
ncbi:diguanylate cyclase (GGDEF)-like protein [Desulfitobacterium sp. LBE]|uniref:GGDEF domain-containing protein n=1 Tax=Desulfitobacterium sp. LBE TaxID=884086 RepID=UPI00119A127B|nr:GGDEF domain-containing protein [Desulfitobacterium sp. LBE]TWH59367.1 diguanylate cyclase (GGDEF)-like protein [Desulfitobacterium sp. LBE]